MHETSNDNMWSGIVAFRMSSVHVCIISVWYSSDHVAPPPATQWAQTFLRPCCHVFSGEGWRLTTRPMSFLVKAMCTSPFILMLKLWLMLFVVVTAVIVWEEILFNSVVALWYYSKAAGLSGVFHVVHFWQTISWNSSLTHNWHLSLAAHNAHTQT